MYGYFIRNLYSQKMPSTPANYAHVINMGKYNLQI